MSSNPPDVSGAATATFTKDNNSNNTCHAQNFLPYDQDVASGSNTTAGPNSIQHGIREVDKAVLDRHPDLDYSLRRWHQQSPREEPLVARVGGR